MPVDRVEPLQIVSMCPRISGMRIGRVVDISRDGRALVDYPGNPYGPLTIRRTASVAPPIIELAYEQQSALLLAFENDDPALPVVIDVLVDGRDAQREVQTPKAISPATSSTEPAAQQSPHHGALIGRIVRVQDNRVFVEFDGNPHGPQPASTTVPLRNLKDHVLLVSAGEQLVIVGQLYSEVPVAADAADACEVVLRGKSIRIEAEDDVVIAAGSSKVHLDARGKAETTADHVVSRARTVNKVQGGCIKLN